MDIYPPSLKVGSRYSIARKDVKVKTEYSANDIVPTKVHSYVVESPIVESTYYDEHGAWESKRMWVWSAKDIDTNEIRTHVMVDGIHSVPHEMQPNPIPPDPPLDKWDKRFLSMAKEYASWSKDPSTKIGAIVIDPKTRNILSGGYNGFPRGIEDSSDHLNNREEKYKRVVHAEMNAIYNATRKGVSLDGSTLYVTGLPVCSECAKGIIQVGIKRVVMANPETLSERWKKSCSFTLKLFEEADIDVTFIPN